MTEFFNRDRLRFYLTEAQPCPYLPGRYERKVFTPLRGPHAANLNDELSMSGFRRSQNVAYRPQCPGCDACLSSRIRVKGFKPRKREKRILRRNAQLQRNIRPAQATHEQFGLFHRYVQHRHQGGAMADMDYVDYISMVEDSTVRTRIIEYRHHDAQGNCKLVAACITDVMADGLSLVYSFFDQALERDSLGAFMILDQVSLAERAELDYVYMGYWVQGCRKMSYKTQFSSVEVLRHGIWCPLEDVRKQPQTDFTRPLRVE